MGERLYVGTLSELASNGYLLAGDKRLPICVFADAEGAPHALDNRCPHMDSLLHLGELHDGYIHCHWHAARFDIVTGCSIDEFVDDVPSFPVELEGEKIFVCLP